MRKLLNCRILNFFTCLNYYKLTTTLIVPTQKNLMLLIARANPHVVFLQEVVKRSEGILLEKFPAYRLISGYEKIPFYTAIMVRTDVVEVDDTVIIPFKTSQMGSNVLAVKVNAHVSDFPQQLNCLKTNDENN